MALFVVLASKRIGDGKNNSFERHIGTELAKLVNEEVIEVQADGDELDFIFNNFQGIPFAWERAKEQPYEKKFKRVQRWFGDHAKFIYHNLRW